VQVPVTAEYHIVATVGAVGAGDGAVHTVATVGAGVGSAIDADDAVVDDAVVV
jgi:hypothetical protein